MTNDYYINQLTVIIDEADSVSDRHKIPNINVTTTAELVCIYSKAKSIVSRITGTKSEFYGDISKAGSIENSIHWTLKLNRISGILRALRSDIENGYLKSISEIIQSEIFSDYLEMAAYLTSEGYKDAAAVIAGSTLEAHLKELAKSNSIELTLNDKPKKASLLNDELAKAGVYSASYQKQIVAWLAIRNDAAHGTYQAYSLEQVKLMTQGVRQFMLK